MRAPRALVKDFYLFERNFAENIFKESRKIISLHKMFYF